MGEILADLTPDVPQDDDVVRDLQDQLAVMRGLLENIADGNIVVTGYDDQGGLEVSITDKGKATVEAMDPEEVQRLRAQPGPWSRLDQSR